MFWQTSRVTEANRTAPPLPDETELGELTDDALTGRFRILQRKRGHRYSVDDLLTAREAMRALEGQPAPEAYLDLGCGIGSVLLMVAHHLSEARIVGVEAQALSFGLAERNVARNGLDQQVRLIHGDLRDPAVHADALSDGRFDLVTGTPPYAPPGTSVPSPDSQRCFARVEMRGGIEDYLAAAAKLVKPTGRVVVCGVANAPERARTGAAAAGLRMLCRVDAIPRAGREALFSVWTFAPEAAAPDAPFAERAYVARDADGQRTEASFRIRTFFGFDPPTEQDS